MSENSVSRREFVKRSVALAAWSTLDAPVTGLDVPHVSVPKPIRIQRVEANFEREPLIRPFGFKGGYMREIWQTASLVESESGHRKIGLCTQNVLYSDATVFAAHTESGGNALMYALTDRALYLAKEIPFATPVELIDTILEKVYQEGKQLTGNPALNKIFALNALISVDNAAWLLYAAQNGFQNFDQMIPAAYKPALAHRHTKVAVIYLAAYALPIADVKRAVEQGYFVIKIKIGQPGTQVDMLEKDKARLTEVHQAIKEARTNQTKNGKLIYTLDANGRYEKKESLLRLLDHARAIGAFDQILFIEEPLTEQNEENVADVGVRVAADESAHDYEGAVRRLEQGYQALMLKGIAKTLSLSMKMAQYAHQKGVPCVCADLTVNPILVDWHKNLAARLAPFPGLNMGLLETNGDLNYRNWKTMQSYHPANGANWTLVRNGVFTLGDDFYEQSGGILKPIPHYEQLFQKA